MLTKQEIQDRVGVRDSWFVKAQNQQTRIAMHSDAGIDTSKVVNSYFTRQVRSWLNPEKYSQFLNFITLPLSTTSLISDVNVSLSKCFDGVNRILELNCSDECLEDARQYTEKVVDSIESNWFSWSNSEFNGLLICDLPNEQTSDLPEPYFYFAPLSTVQAIKVDEQGKILSVAIKQFDDYLVYDELAYYVYDATNPSNIILRSRDEHSLGYCPATTLWQTPLAATNRFVKKSPISYVLGDLDKLLFFDISNFDLGTYSRFPILSVYNFDCDYVMDDGSRCVSGYMKGGDNKYIFESNTLKPCPVCSQRGLRGAGTVIKVDPPDIENSDSDLIKPVHITSPDIDTLEYNDTDVATRRNKLYTDLTGYETSTVNKQAINEKQVLATFERLESSLRFVQENVEKTETFIIDTVLKLRHGDDYESCYVSLGTEHFILPTSELLNLYKLSKEANFSPSTLDLLEERYYVSQFRNNASALQRQKMIFDLDLFRHKDVEDVAEMFDKGVVSKRDYLYKFNFNSYIQKFEIENSKINLFGQTLKYSTRINNIRNSIYKYVDEQLKTIEDEQSRQTKQNKGIAEIGNS